MLVLGSKLNNTPIMGLQTGTRLANAKAPVIDPSNLKILAYEVEGPLLVDKPSYIRIADIRELSNIGMIIDSSEEFIALDDVIAIKKICELNFDLIGLLVVDDNKRKLGKVNDFIVDTNSFVIQQLSVKRGIIKSISETDLLIHRSQILEISNYQIIVKAPTKKLESIDTVKELTYLNPFRQTNPQTENSTLQNKV